MILFADDAALPADSPEDLQLLASIFEEFCNDNRLFIAVPKTSVTVFHSAQDSQVEYRSELVFVDGRAVAITIYSQFVKAVAEFKYLGVVVDRHGNPASHMKSRLSALKRAGGMLIASMYRLPSFTHGFLRYLWITLVKPVGVYGMAVYPWTCSDMAKMRKAEASLLRRVLRLEPESW